MSVIQLSVFLENRPGHLQSILRILSENDINITAFTISETADYGILRMIVNDPDRARQVLKAGNITSRITHVLAIEIEDRPGSLYRVLDAFARKDMNIEYMYAFPGKKADKSIMIFRFENIDEAESALAAEGYTIVTMTDITGE